MLFRSAHREAVAAELAFAESEYQRATRLHKERVFADDELDKRRQQAATLQKQVASAEKQAEAMKRGPFTRTRMACSGLAPRTG